MTLLNSFINFLNYILNFKIYNITILNYLIFYTVIATVFMVIKIISNRKN